MDKIEVIGIDNVMPAVLERHPTAWKEGSAGLGNTFCVTKEGGGYDIVAISRPKHKLARLIEMDTCKWVVEFGDPFRNKDND